MHKRLEHMKETLMCAVEMQLCDLGDVDTEELGAAIDMIKDLEEAIYYCTVTEAMNSGGEMEWEMKKNGQHQKEGEEGGNGEKRMFYNGSRGGGMNYMPYAEGGEMYAERRRRADGTFYADSGSSYAGGGGSYAGGGSSQSGGSGGSSYSEGGMGMSYNAMNGGPMYAQGGSSYMDGGQGYRDSREGRSYNSRRMYMEAKDMKKDKAS